MNQDQTESKNANTQSSTPPELSANVEANSKSDQEITSSDNKETNTNSDEVTFLSVVLSVIQASFGVQSQKNRERDFKKGTLLPFVVTAIMFTILFVLGLSFLVQMVIA